MGLFNRKNTETVLPPEVNQYYASQRRERAGMMAIFGFSALIITILVGLALFFGGRALYRNIYADKNDSKSTSQEESKDSSPSGLSIAGSANGADSSNVNKGTGGSSSTSSTDANNSNNSQSSNSSSTQTATTNSMPNTGDAPTPTELPKTGDEGM